MADQLPLVRLYVKLPLPVGGPMGKAHYRFSAQPIPGNEQHRIGRSQDNNPVILISTNLSLDHPKYPPVVLRHLAGPRP
jgi:hypothetical protein